MTSRTTTADLGPKTLRLPPKCITASSLHSLAGALDRLAAFHQDRGGPAPDAPCLTEVVVEDGVIRAFVRSGEQTFHLRMSPSGVWSFAP